MLKFIIPLILISFVVSLMWVAGHIKYINFLNNYNAGSYLQALQDTDLKSPEMLHNYGNAAFNIFTASWSTQAFMLRAANEYYSGSLSLQEHPDTRYNYEFTKSLLELYQDEQQQEKDNQDSNSSEQWENPQSSEDGQNWNEKNQQTPWQNGRDEQYYLNEQDSIAPLSEAEKQELEKNIENLKRDQMRNQQFYGKQEQLSPFQEAFESFFWGIDRWEEKDW